MKKIILPLLLFITLYTTAQVGIGTKIPEPSAMLEVKSNSKGVLISRMTESERSAIKTPAAGLLVYQTDGSAGFYYHTGTEWKYLPPASTTVALQSSANLTAGLTATTVSSVSGTANRITSTGGATPIIDIASTYPGQSSITTVGTIGTGTWNGTVISSAKGGAGTVNGLLKANGSGTVSAAVYGTDYLKPNTAITAGTKTKITYDSKGLITGGSNALTTDIAEGTNKYFTDARSRAALSLTTTGTSGAATYSSSTGVLNIPQYSGGSGGTTYSFASPLALNTGTVSIPQATSVTSGYLTSTDWSTFNNKLSTAAAASTYATITSVNGKVTSNNAITGATKTKITYDTKGLVTSGTDATTSDIAEGTNLYFTEQRVRNTPLTGYIVGSNTAVANTDNVMGSIAKLQGQINAKQSSGQAWLLGGNAGTDPSTQFIGTTDNNDLVFKVNNTQAGRINTSNSNTSFGIQSMIANTTGDGNVGIGYKSLTSNIGGQRNVGIGFESLHENLNGENQIAIGYRALYNSNSINNIGIGWHSLYSNTSGAGNTSVGHGGLYSNTIGVKNTSLGQDALAANTEGNDNVALGFAALSSSIIGSNNVSVGNNSLSQSTAWFNTAIGYNTSKLTTTGQANSAFGQAALYNNTTGSDNTAIGGEALGLNVSGNKNTALGAAAEVGADNLTNATAIGSNSKVDCDNCLVLGSVNGQNSATSSVRVGIGTTNPEPSAALEVKSTTQGLLLPRMTAEQRDNIVNPVQGLVVYCTNCGTKGQMNVYDGTEWTDMNGDATKPDINSLPVLSTTAISDTTAISATSGGNITSVGGTSIIARGIVWGTSSNPTISLGTKTTDGTGTGNYSSQITGLSANSTYYVRAYATNTAGTAYGNEISFTSNSITLTLNLTWSLVTNGDCLNIIQGKLSTDLFLIRRTDVLKSTDGGSTWANTNWPLGIVRSNTSATGGVAYSSFGNGQLAVAALDNGWYISSDDGASYQATGPTGFGTGAPGMTSLSDGSFISGNGGFLRGIYKTSGIDNLTWSQKYSGTDIYNFAKVNDDTLYSSGYGNEPLLKSFDKGETWTPMIQTQSAIDYITIKNDSILVTNRDGNITVSSRFNFNSSTTPKYTIAGSADFKRGIYSKSDNLLIISANHTGFYISNDFGNTFQLYTIPSATLHNNPAIIGNSIYINTDVGLYSSKFK